MPALSYSRIKDFETCPYRLKLIWDVYKTKAKNALKAGSASERGTKIHNEVEDFLANKTDEYPIQHFYEEFQNLRTTKNLVIEEPWAFDKDWNELHKFDKNADIRTKADFYYFEAPDHLIITDLKTGKHKPIAKAEQSQFMAITAFHKFPQLSKVSVPFKYVDSGFVPPPLNITRTMIPIIQERWDKRMNVIRNTEEWSPKPTKYSCSYCSVRDICEFESEDAIKENR